MIVSQPNAHEIGQGDIHHGIVVLMIVGREEVIGWANDGKLPDIGLVFLSLGSLQRILFVFWTRGESCGQGRLRG